MKVGKPKSKRVPVRLRNKIEKASSAKQRKQRKLAKKNPEWRSRLKKDPGIPNLFPYKDRILHEIEEKRRVKDAESARRAQEAKARRLGIDPGAVDGDEIGGEVDEMVDEDGALLDLEDAEEDEAMGDDDSSNPMAALLASARARAVEFARHDDKSSKAHVDAMEENETEDDDGDDAESFDGFDDKETPASSKAKRPPRSATSDRSTLPTLLSRADIILYVLDARDPAGTRSRAVERAVAAADGGSKRLILVLNKVDLVPPNVLKGWLAQLRRYFPTIPLRASTPASGAHTFEHKSLTVKGTVETLLRALRGWAQSRNLRRSVTVGVAGYPNVGKSSVVNALLGQLGGSRSRRGGATDSCPTGAEAGVTTSVREVKLDGRIRLLDSPGVVYPGADDAASKPNGADADATAQLVLLSALPPHEVTDPVPAVALLLRRLSVLSSSLSAFPSGAAAVDPYGCLLNHYGIPADTLMASAGTDIVTDFLVQVARRRGRLGRGGVPNLHAAAMCVLGDWRDGRLVGWCEAPALQAQQADPEGAGSAAGEYAGAGMSADEKEIVQGWAEEFKIEGLWGDDGDAGDEAMAP